jgi:hypothetical protein
MVRLSLTRATASQFGRKLLQGGDAVLSRRMLQSANKET